MQLGKWMPFQPWGETNPDRQELQRLLGLHRVIRREKGSRSPDRGKDRSPRQKGSRRPRNSRSPKGNKGKPDTPRASPAAVCLIALMLASVSNACLLPPVDVISCPAVTFNHNCEAFDAIAKGDLVPSEKQHGSTGTHPQLVTHLNLMSGIGKMQLYGWACWQVQSWID